MKIHPDMSMWRGAVAAAGLALGMAFSAQAQNCTNTYRWLMFFHAPSITQTATYWNGPTENWGWLSAYGGAYDANTMDRWRQMTWDRDVLLSGLIIHTWHQRTGGSIGSYKVQYSPDGSSGWTDVPTADPFSGDGYYNTDFTSTVTARAARVFFPALSYDMGSGGYGGPGVFQMLFRGNVGGGMDPTDPQFDILMVPGFQGVNPVITFPGRSLQEGGGAAYMNDGVVTHDPLRTGWYPPLTRNEVMQVDLGPSRDGSHHLWQITGVRLYAGIFYYYMPSAVDVSISSDGITWGSTMAMSSVSGVMTKTNINMLGRYIKLTDASASTNTYYLVHELSVSAYTPPPLGIVILLR